MMERSSFSGKVRRLCKKLKSDKRAIMLPMFALMFAAMLAFLGLLFDGGRMYFEKRRMQVAADAGARGGALDLLRFGVGSSYIDSGGKDDASLNGFTHGEDTVTVTINNPPSAMAAAIYQNTGCVEAIISETFPTTLMRVASATSATVAARATACIQDDLDPPCILSMYCGDAQAGLIFNGAGELVAKDCNVVVNSQSDEAIRINGAGGCPPARLKATGDGLISYGKDGGVLQNGANECIYCEGCEDGPLNGTSCYQDPYCAGYLLGSSYYPGSCEQLADPWDPVPAWIDLWTIGNITNGTYIDPAEFPVCAIPGDSSGGPCFDSTALPAENGYPAGALLLPPGYYQGKGVIITGGRVIFDCDDLVNGCLYMGSQLSINGGTVLADGVTYYITPDGSPATAGLDISGNAGEPPDIVDFSAPTGGTFQNIAFFSSRYTTEKDCIVTGGSTLFIEGVIYCPTGNLEFGGNSGVLPGTGFVQLTGYTIELHGNPNLEANFVATGRAPGFSIVALVE